MTQQLAEAPTTPQAAPNWNGPIRLAAVIIAAIVLVPTVGSVIGFFMIRNSAKTAYFENPVTRLQVSGDTGDVVVRVGTQATGATVVSRSQSSFRTATHSETVTGGVLKVNGSCQGSVIFPADSCSVDFEITVPPGTEVDARTSTGSLSVTGTGGPVTAKSSTGDIRVSRASGPVQLSTNVGDIVGEFLNGGTVSGHSNTGDVRFSFTATPNRLQAETDVGDIRVTVPDDASSYRVIARTDVGERYIDIPTDPSSTRIAQLRTNTGDIRISLLNR